MPLFMGVQTMVEATSAVDVIAAHAGAERLGFGVTCLRSWMSEPPGKVFCLVEADDADLARSVHARSGLVADEWLRVRELL